MPASQWQEPEGQPEDRTRVTGTYEIDRTCSRATVPRQMRANLQARMLSQGYGGVS